MTVHCLELHIHQHYTDTLQSLSGCDSRHLDLTINNLNSGDTTILVACDSAEWNGVTYDSRTIHIAGCDSIILGIYMY